jgi:hypothetical protein
VGRKLMKVGQKSSMWLVGRQLGIRSAKTEVKARKGRKEGRKERLGTGALIKPV